ncbi:Thioredoxin [Salegentibacter agarivorans]|uniref:Thioredoxin n=1 Tax=Salegentibacter agarivorans TaxID=345907 RepID=A0A1I2N9R6_9FLAO|nr:vitamin K epoxide reductase family protein [Salegentibacter agarivorans]SFG00228.1 Thioredoxin [Salegentibacter agarivorans]
MDNSVNAIKKILELLRVKNTKKYIEDSVLSHPDHPSLLAVSDTLLKFKIENLAININEEKINDIPLPCLVQVKKDGASLFYVLNKISNKGVEYFDDKNKLTKVAKEEFFKIWTGICLLAEATEESGEINIEQKLFSKNLLYGLKIGIGLLLFTWILGTFFNSESKSDFIPAIYIALYTILKITGLLVGGMLLWFDVDQYNPTLQNFCTGNNKKINCNSVLNSKHSKLFKDTLSLSELSFAYFLGTLSFLILQQFSSNTLYILGIISFITLPVIIYSLYYQAFIIKQWCKFCVIIQVVLSFEIFVSFYGNFYNSNIQINTIPLFLALLLVPLLAWKLIKPLLEAEKETNIYKQKFNKIKYNPVVLESLLLKSRKISNSTEDLGISIFNSTAKYNIIKVCNPYCGPCANAHPILEELVNTGKINLQILFTAESIDDRNGKPVSHFLAIDDFYNRKKTKQALDDWYLADQKNYEVFARKYPMNGELKKQISKVEAMRKWCKAENITHTPTIFINGYELPREYSIQDLKEIL